VAEWLGNAGVMVRVVGDWLVDFWGLWCRIAVEVGCVGYLMVMVVGDGGCYSLARVVGECGSLAEVGVGWC
jgi:hypothetical protein